MTIALAFGALAPPLATQLNRKPSDVALWQKDADAITRLLVRGLMSESAGRAARRKLLRVIARHLTQATADGGSPKDSKCD